MWIRTTCFFSHRYTAKARAFTLLELLLVIVIMVTLAAVIWPNMSGRRAAVTLKSKADQLASLMMFARSGAMSTGCNYRCVFELKGMKAVLETESDPYQKPGEYEAIKAHWATLNFSEDDISCQAVEFDAWDQELKDQEADILENDSQSKSNDDSSTLAPILFYPDGTSDSAKLLLGDNENNFMTLSLNGITGEVKMERGNMLATDSDKKKK